jgi:D-galactarolactone cycloisomerase
MVPSPVRLNPIEPILEFDRTDNPFRQAVITRPIEHDEGVVAIPDGPGLGVEINRDALREFAPKDAG